MNEFNFLNVPRFWKGLPHQVAALNYLWENTSSEVRKEFIDLWRNPNPKTDLITLEQLKQIFFHSRFPKRLEEFLPNLNLVMAHYEINTPLRIAHFLAQLGHESQSLNYLEEIWGPTPAQRSYEGRRDLGNTQPGDGSKFRGYGPIQITGRNNVTKFSSAIGRPEIVENPRLLTSPELGSLSAGWFWNEGNSTGRSLNRLADADDLRGITRIVNGGLNGLADRRDYLERAKRVLAIKSDPTVERPILQIGSAGSEVAELQYLLNQRGYKLDQDGKFGPLTEAAVRDFQSWAGLVPDGIVDPITDRNLRKLL